MLLFISYDYVISELRYCHDEFEIMYLLSYDFGVVMYGLHIFRCYVYVT